MYKQINSMATCQICGVNIIIKYLLIFTKYTIIHVKCEKYI